MPLRVSFLQADYEVRPPEVAEGAPVPIAHGDPAEGEEPTLGELPRLVQNITCMSLSACWNLLAPSQHEAGSLPAGLRLRCELLIEAVPELWIVLDPFDHDALAVLRKIAAASSRND